MRSTLTVSRSASRVSTTALHRSVGPIVPRTEALVELDEIQTQQLDLATAVNGDQSGPVDNHRCPLRAHPQVVDRQPLWSAV